MHDTLNIYWQKQRAIRLLGDVFSVKDKEQSAVYYQRAIELAKHYPYQALHVIIQLGKLHATSKRYKEAEINFKEAERIATVLDQRHAIPGIFIALADLYAAQDMYEKAYNYEDAFLFVYDSLIKAERDGRINALEIKYKTAEKDRDIANKKLLLSKQNNKIVRNNMLIGIAAVGMCILIIGFAVFYFYKRRLYAMRIEALTQKEEVNNLLAIVKGEEKERSRLGRELHDGIGGLLASTRMFFGNLQKKEPALTNSNDYAEAIRLLDETIFEVRKTAHNLLPDLLFNLGLPETVRTFCNTVQRANNIKVNFQYYGFIGRLNMNFELFVYRIVQELLQNIIKHASATEVLVQLSKHDNTLTITVEDNGVGMNLEEAAAEGMGLQLIRSRIKELKGQLNISSTSGIGTSVYIELDFEDQKNAIL